ncbi:FIG015547: peptidase, M16 family [hydrothermal vent metagenome]|uniref:FIG015547: peptidase, M16 family n=1 Tax=hydrothermal vent metagenome TaxID=652676 RepID=A0A3B0W2Z6_9ZZZZ
MKTKSIVVLLVVSTVVLGWVLFHSDDPASEDNNDTVQSYQLSNGMKILVIENHRAPVMVSQVWYKVGSSYEHDGITGVSHVLEHMMFKGTEKHPAGEFSEIIAANGGEENAFTGQDYTAYFQKIANDRLELCLELEADRMRNVIFDEKEFAKELEVVKEERRLRTDDKPTALTYERFNAVAFTNSPYRRPIIGWMEDLDTLTVEDAKQWYKTWYAPNNATLVVAGDVSAEEVFRLAKQYFGQLPTSKIPKLKPRHEVKQYGTQRLTVELPAKIPYLIMGYKAPILTAEIVDTEQEKELYALEVLAGVLDGGSSARLSKNLVRGQEIASSAGAGYGMSSRHDTLFVLTAVPNEDVAIEVLEFALREEINIIKSQRPDDKELDRVKAQVVAAQVYKQDSTFYQAMEVGMLDTIGLPWHIKDEYVEKILAVTAQQVQQVANKYLTDDRLTVAVLEPLPVESSTTEHSTAAPVVDDKAKKAAGEKDAQ